MLLTSLHVYFIYLMSKGYQKLALQEDLVMSRIFVFLTAFNFTVRYKIFLPTIWWSWSILLLFMLLLQFFSLRRTIIRQ